MPEESTEKKTLTEFCDYNSGEHRNKAAETVAKGGVIGVFNRGVCALWIDPSKPEAVEEINRIKGEARTNRPMGATIPAADVVNLIDLSAVDPHLEELIEVLENPDSMRERLGSYTFFRFPVKPEIIRSLPSKIVDNGVMQNWDPTGHYPASHLVRRMKALGVNYPAITSMNISGQPEITDSTVGKMFSREHGIPIFLDDPLDQHFSIGSYPIVELRNDGLYLVREGNIPPELLQRLVGLPFNISEAKPSKYPHHHFPEELFSKELDVTTLRAAFLMYFKGIPVEHIRKTINH